MCESTVFIEEKGQRIEFMKDVARIDVTTDGIVCYDIIGERRAIKGVKLKIANLMNHSIIFEK
jgi:predicted RNA-binding protein